jgi:hypothetical protein
MRPLLGEWHRDFSLPFPCVAQLWPTAHDWFTEDDEHPDFTLEVEAPAEGDAPTLDQIRQAWQLATDSGATPLMNVSVVPAEPWGVAVTGMVEALYVVGQALEPELLDRIADSLGANVLTTPALNLDAEPILTSAGFDAIGDAHAWAWEWLYGA